MASVTIKVKKNIADKALKQKFDQLDLLTDTQTSLAIYDVLKKECNPYVPRLYGPLSENAQTTPEGVVYGSGGEQPYARYQYYGVNFKHTLDYHPLASAKWNQAMMRDKKDEFTKQIKDIIEWRIKQSNAGR